MATATVQQDTIVVDAIHCLHESPQAVIFLINTPAKGEKYPQVQLWNSRTIHLKGCVIKFDNLPFKGGHLLFMPDRHCIQVCIYNSNLQESISLDDPKQTLFLAE